MSLQNGSGIELGQDALEFYNLASGRLLSALEVTLQEFVNKNSNYPYGNITLLYISIRSNKRQAV